MASTPTDEHCFILDSFQEFESLARRALHEGGFLDSYVFAFFLDTLLDYN